jgi:hypothetical protein
MRASLEVTAPLTTLKSEGGGGREERFRQHRRPAADFIIPELSQSSRKMMLDIALPEPSVKTDRLDSPIYHPDEAVVRAGQEAWCRLRSNATWDDWKQVGKAHVIGRHKAMIEAGVNQPIGRRYNEAFGTWQREFGFENLDKGDRTRLFEGMGHLAKIDAWLTTLTTSERLRLNHPATVLRKWKGSTAVPDPNATQKPSPYALLKGAHAELIEEHHRLQKKIETADGDLWKPTDTAADIADVMVAALSPAKAERTASEILKRVKERRARGA